MSGQYGVNSSCLIGITVFCLYPVMILSSHSHASGFESMDRWYSVIEERSLALMVKEHTLSQIMCEPVKKHVKAFHDLRRMAVRGLAREDVPKIVSEGHSGTQTRAVLTNQYVQRNCCKVRTSRGHSITAGS